MKDTNRKYISNFTQIAIYIYLINAMCKYFLPGTLTKLLPIMALVIAVVVNEQPFKFQATRMDKTFVLFLFVWFIGCFYSTDMSKGIRLVLAFAIPLFFGFYIWKKKLVEEHIMKIIAIVCTIIAFGIILQPIIPNTINSINQLFGYSQEEYSVMAAWTRNNWYSGLLPDRTPAAFYCCILIGAGLYFIYANYKRQGTFLHRMFGFIFIFIGIYGILLTAKRGLLLGALAAALFTFVVYKKAYQKSILKIFILIILVSILGWVIFRNFEATQVMISRFFNNNNFFTYRISIYQNLINEFLKNPIMGTGTASATDILSIGGHNIYLTVLMENGIMGFVLFTVSVLYSMFFTIKTALMIGKSGKVNKLPFIMFSLYIQVFFIVYGMTGNPLYDNYILYFYLFSLIIAKNVDFHYRNDYMKESV